MAAGNLDDPLSDIPNVVVVDQSAATAAPGAGYARIECVNGVLGVRVGSGAWVALVALTTGLLSALTEKVAPVAGDWVLLQDEEDSSALKKADVANLPGAAPGGGLFDAYARYTYSVSAGTGGGSAANDAWTTLPWNTEASDPSSIGALASNQITLQPGSYYLDASVSAHNGCGQFGLRLRNITAGTTLLVNGPTYNSGGGGTSSIARLNGRFTLAEESVIEVQYYSDLAVADIGLGLNSNFGENNVHRQVTIFRETA